MTHTRWCVLIPQKALARAKGRLDLDPTERRAVATAMLRDTVQAVLLTPAVARVMVLWDDGADATLLPDIEGLDTAGKGLNGAIEAGAVRVRLDDPGFSLAVVPGDLPALNPFELDECLGMAAAHRRAFLPDAAGIGTTVLTATSGTNLRAHYGHCSTLAHAASDAHLIRPTGLRTLRADVDDLGTLARALELGCGRHTRSACMAAGLIPELVP
jgi:2-phospho-L-lactate guanylyltransferase